MRVVAYTGAAAVAALVIVMAVAGVSGATAILVTVAALLVMIVLGGKMGGRHTPNVPPADTGAARETPDTGAGATEPTMDG